MLIIGLIAGPAIGLLAGDLLFRTSSIGRVWGALVCLLMGVAALVAPFFDLGLRAGLVMGLVIGLLLVITPVGGSFAPTEQ